MVGCYFNVTNRDIVSAIEGYLPENNRSQIKKTTRNTLIVDSYNANPSSMESALNSFDEISAKNKVLILGEMKELGENSISEHRTLIELTEKLNVTKRYLVGREFCSLLPDDKQVFKSTDDLITELNSNPLNDCLIFIKGSRANKLEEVEKFL
jgi:UDP-N-acetylmuramoyl-tripeptide--D-alanyl-D-alanine ligase